MIIINDQWVRVTKAQAAIHEAAHVVIGLALELKILSVEIYQTQGMWLGTTQFETHDDIRDVGELQWTLTLLAGSLAEHRQNSIKCYDISVTDLKMADETWAARNAVEIPALLHAAEALVALHWRSIRLLAIGLKRHLRYDGDTLAKWWSEQ